MASLKPIPLVAYISNKSSLLADLGGPFPYSDFFPVCDIRGSERHIVSSSSDTNSLFPLAAFPTDLPVGIAC